MRVLLLDLDIITKRRPFPNLALMKLSAYHKARGNEVFLNFPLCLPDLTFASCVFTWNARNTIGISPDASLGGSGIDLKTELPPEVEHIKPDYSLYANTNFSLGFTSRGCIRKCPWCLVPDKEGTIKPWAHIYEFWDHHHRKIVLLDNNLLASPNWKETLSELGKENVEVDFNQGLDIRLLDDEKVSFLKGLRTRVLRFAFDDIAYEKAVRTGIELLLNAGIAPRKLSFYMLVGFTGDKSAIERAELLNAYGVEIYPMIYKGANGREPELAPEVFNLSSYHGSWHNLRKFQRVISRGKTT